MSGQGTIDSLTGLSNQARGFGEKIRRMEILIAHNLFLNGYAARKVCKMMMWKQTKENMELIKLFKKDKGYGTEDALI